jgi:hypothetical protein
LVPIIVEINKIHLKQVIIKITVWKLKQVTLAQVERICWDVKGREGKNKVVILKREKEKKEKTNFCQWNIMFMYDYVQWNRILTTCGLTGAFGRFNVSSSSAITVANVIK